MSRSKDSWSTVILAVCFVVFAFLVFGTVQNDLIQKLANEEAPIYLRDPFHWMGDKIHVPGAQLVEGRDDLYTLEGNPLVVPDTGRPRVVEVEPGDILAFGKTGLVGNQLVSYSVCDQKGCTVPLGAANALTTAD